MSDIPKIESFPEGFDPYSSYSIDTPLHLPRVSRQNPFDIPRLEVERPPFLENPALSNLVHNPLNKTSEQES